MGAMSGRGGSWWRVLVLSGGLLGLAASLAVIGATLRKHGSQDAANVAQLVSVVLAVPPLVFGLVTWWRRSARPVAVTGTAEMLRAKDVLARLVAAQWNTEAAIRSLDHPDPMPVRWQLTARRGVMARPEHVATGGPAFAGSSARIADLTEQFRALRRRRLVILGGPGTGKTTLAVQLVRELLASPREHEPVPVLLSAASWDTEAFPKLHDWLEVRLAQDYPSLRAPEFGTDLPRALATNRQILPVLDGLDELPDGARAAAIAALNGSLSDQDQLILTSRTDEFTQAVQTAGNALNSAAVIKPQLLTPAAAADYLESCLPAEPGPVWTQILGGLKISGHDHGPASTLATITSNPLGLWLVRTTYITSGDDPGLLLEPGHFPDAATLRTHLFNHLVPALIKIRLASDNPADRLRLRQSRDPEKVRDWLGFLADRLNRIPTDDGQAGTRDFAWWQLARYTLRYPYVVKLARLLWLAPALGLGYGLGAGLVGGLVGGLARGWGGLRFGIEFGLELGIWFGLAGGLRVLVSRLLGRPADTSWLTQTPGFAKLARRPISRSHLRLRGLVVFCLVSVLVGGLAGAILGGVVFAGGLEDWLAGGILGGLVGGLPGGFVLVIAFVGGLAGGLIETPAQEDQASTPLTTWQADRSLNLLRTLTGGLMLGLGSVLVGLLAVALMGVPAEGLKDWLANWLMVGLELGLVVGLTGGRHHAWLVYLQLTYRMAWRRRLPRRLMPFLDDMHSLGLLRAVGSLYQFRHADLQDHLATAYRPGERGRRDGHRP